jgi:hypothetical protein
MGMALMANGGYSWSSLEATMLRALIFSPRGTLQRKISQTIHKRAGKKTKPIFKVGHQYIWLRSANAACDSLAQHVPLPHG